MRNLIFFLFFLFFTTACGGGSGDGTNNESGGSGATGQSSSDIYEKTNSLISKTNGQGQYNGTITSLGGFDDSTTGCSEYNLLAIDELKSLENPTTTSYSICGKQKDSYNPICVYTSANAYRISEINPNENELYGQNDWYKEYIYIPVNGGLAKVYLGYNSVYYNYVFKAYNNVNECNLDSTKKESYHWYDIEGEYSAKIIRIDSKGVPVAEKTGSITCYDGRCNGIISILEIQYDDEYNFWYGTMLFNEAELNLMITISPDKSVAFFTGYPNLSELTPTSFTKNTVFMVASKIK